MALVWFVDKFPRSRKPVQYRRLDDIVSFNSQVDRQEGQLYPTQDNGKNNGEVKNYKKLRAIGFIH